MMTPQE